MAIDNKFQLQVKQLSKAVLTISDALRMEPTQINKDGTIQRFEYTYELCWKTMQTPVKTSGILDVNSPRESIRAAAQIGLIENVEIWFDFLDARNQASHVYDESSADLVYEVVKKFLPEAEKLVKKMLI